MTVSTTDSSKESGQRFEIKTATEAFKEYTRMELERLCETEPDFDQSLFEDARSLVLKLLQEPRKDDGGFSS